VSSVICCFVTLLGKVTRLSYVLRLFLFIYLFIFILTQNVDRRETLPRMKYMFYCIIYVPKYLWAFSKKLENKNVQNLG